MSQDNLLASHVIEFERNLKVGDHVEVRWTAGSFGHFKGKAEVIRINKSSFRVKLLEEVGAGRWGSYRLGQELRIPSYFTKTWAHFNRLYPLEPT